jgi:hypothetical protein
MKTTEIHSLHGILTFNTQKTSSREILKCILIKSCHKTMVSSSTTWCGHSSKRKSNPHQEDKHYWAKIQYNPCGSNSSVGQHGFKENSTLLTMGLWYVNCASQPVNRQLLTVRPSETKSVWHHNTHINTNLICTKGKKRNKDTGRKVLQGHAQNRTG